MGSLSLLKQIREAEPRLSVIVISATQDNKLSAEALRSGAVAYLPKPFDPRHVEMLVTTFLDPGKPRSSKPIPDAR
jgi:DNA-binding NtrC family response regulator